MNQNLNFPLKAPSQSFTGRISRLLSAVAILDHIDIAVLTTRGEACHWILSRLRLPTAQLSATHDDLRVASLLRYGCHRLTTICASLRSFKLCSLVQLMFAATPEGEPSHLAAAQTLNLNSFTSNLNSAFFRTSTGCQYSSPISCGRCRCCSFLRPRRTGRRRRGGW